MTKKTILFVSIITVLLAFTVSPTTGSVIFDGLTWYYSGNTSDLFINGDGDLEWDPDGGEQFITRIPEQSLSQVGDVVQISYMWLTDGAHNCADCFDCELFCHDDDITCIAGTSDMRVALCEADGEYVESDGFAVTGSSIFNGYKGYNFRFGANMVARDPNGLTRWRDCHGEIHKTGMFAKKPVGNSDLMFYNDGLKDRIPGFELPPGDWSQLTVSLKRTSSSNIRMTITLNDRTYIYDDDSGTDQPSKIDVLAVHMRNHRPYSRLVLGKVCSLGAADLNADDIIDGNDLSILAGDWLLTGGAAIPPNPASLVLRYSFDGTLGGNAPSDLLDDTGHYTATIIAGTDPDSTIRYAEPNPTFNPGGTSAQFYNDNWSNNAGDTFMIPNSGGINFNSFSEFTVQLFINPSSAGSGQTRRVFSEYIYAYMYLDASDTLHAIRKWGGGSWNENWTHLTKASFPHDDWSHLAMTWDADAVGDRLKLHVDGELVASAPGTSTPTIDSTAGFAIGGYQREDTSRAQFFCGNIDEFELYDYALSEAEVAYVANNGQIPPASPANLYNDGIINFKDYVIFASQWLDTCE
ncbi:MAG: LamG domain-containing protein [Planctomycetota bacterium]